MKRDHIDRRRFLQAAPLAAAAAAAGAGAGAVPAAFAERPAPPADAGPLLDVRRLGAAGDGSTDDTAALRSAIDQAKRTGAAGLFLPAGIYMLSDALHLPGDFRLIGAGRDATILKAVPGTLFAMYRPDPRTAELRQRRTLITTESVATVREPLVRNLAIEQLTLDWSNCPTDGLGHSVALIDSADNVTLRELAVINAMPADHPPTAEQTRAGGANFRCECIMFSNARDGLMERCLLTDSGYRPLSVSYGSLNIIFRNGLIHAEKPIWRHCFSETHGDGLPRDETFVRSQLFFADSVFILDGGTPHDGICSHTGSTSVHNCDFYIRSAPATFAIILRAFDGSRNCTYTNNRFHLSAGAGGDDGNGGDDGTGGGGHAASFSIMATTRRTNPAREHDQDILFADNLIDIDLPEAQPDRARARPRPRPLIHLQDGDRRVRIAGNLIRVRGGGRSGCGPVIQLEQTAAFTITGNLIDLEPPASDAAPAAILLQDCRHGRIAGNILTGGPANAIQTAGDGPGLLISDNVEE